MRIGVIAQNLLERVALATGRMPTPLIECVPTIILARALMAATELGVFEALAAGPQPAETIADRCATHAAATASLLEALVGAGYLRRNRAGYALTPVARRWLVRDAPRSVSDYLRFNVLQWDWLGRSEAFLRTGAPIDVHAELDAAGWDSYQRAMRCLARLSAAEVARRVPVPRGARSLLDIGGANGVYAAALCQRHAGLRATILDLPPALAANAAALAADPRLTLRAGDVREAELGRAAFDVIFVANVLHHFDAATNRDLIGRAARALRPGGVLVIQEGLRVAATRADRQFGALGGFFFALTSAAGVWSAAEMVAWQRAAGLHPLPPRRLRTAPGQGLLAARQRSSGTGG